MLVEAEEPVELFKKPHILLVLLLQLLSEQVAQQVMHTMMVEMVAILYLVL